nr:immunoglobulin heavy chain junction region [Mus musculus]
CARRHDGYYTWYFDVW